MTAITAITYPPDLPITARRDELLATIRDHQVVVVAGETGSGKSTQLPKLCLELGRGGEAMIGHTQPRRVAARTIAERIGAELAGALGPSGADLVASSVRFDDRVGPATRIRVMTDGILLAELARDRDLRRYDTLIVDEAHERSLNVDFLLGYLRRLLPRRPDLKVVVTSATIDTARFAEHFASPAGTPAPIVDVAGRTFPVEVRYRPFGADAGDDRDQVQAVVAAIDELPSNGDVLVFLSGEREIHDTADALRARRDGTDVLPLYARLSAPEQHRIFEPHPGRRIVLATNVAETSITVPGVRSVVDAGTARISRYSRRLKVQRLPIEPISRASADQRAGRCGRVAPGTCIRLYGEDDYLARPAFTEPEILRTNLASVILQMLALGLGDVASFPFVEAPDPASIRDGDLLLEELGAIDERGGARRLTGTGRRLARLPVDPRLGRMVLEADREGCVREVLAIAAALSIQDPRERPADQREQADALHRRFDVAGSDLLSIVAMWDHLRERQRAMSGNQFRRMCRDEHLHYLRVREWRDVYGQLRQVAGDLGIRAVEGAAPPDAVHRAVLTGLLSHVGTREREARDYRGARGSTFAIAAGSVLAKRSPRWVMAAELVETNRLWARRVAGIEPSWLEHAGAHLVRRSYGEARWDERRAAAVTTETVTLYGLPVVTGRTVPLDRIDPQLARQLFLRHGLVQREWVTHHAFLDRNDAFRARLATMEARVRRAVEVDDEQLLAFYDERVPADVSSGRRFDRWWRDAGAADPERLDLAAAGLEGVPDLAGHPDRWRQGELDLALSYRFDPGGPLDGVSVHVPLTALSQLTDEGFDWQIPGYRDELVDALVRTLPKAIRRDLIPMADTVRAATERLGPPHGRLVDALAAALRDVSGVDVRADDLDESAVPAHLLVNVIVVDEAGVVRDADSDLAAIRRRQAPAVREAIASALGTTERRGIVDWDVGTLQRVLEAPAAGHVVRGYPALLDDGSAVSLRVLTNADLQRRVMRGGVRRLLLLTAAPRVAGRLADDIRAAAVDAVLDEVIEASGDLPWDEAAFRSLQQTVRERAPTVAARVRRATVEVLGAAARVRTALDGLRAPALARSVADARAHLDRLVGPGFVVTAGATRLDDLHRYVRGVEHRLERLGGDVARDRRRMAEVVPLEGRLERLAANDPRAADLRWQLEELRVSLFAQPIGARGAVSATRIARTLDAWSPSPPTGWTRSVRSPPSATP